MGFTLSELKNVTATKTRGEKADVQVWIRTNTGEFTEGISINLVSNHRQNTDAKRWKIPTDVVAALKVFGYRDR